MRNRNQAARLKMVMAGTNATRHGRTRQENVSPRHARLRSLKRTENRTSRQKLGNDTMAVAEARCKRLNNWKKKIARTGASAHKSRPGSETPSVIHFFTVRGRKRSRSWVRTQARQCMEPLEKNDRQRQRREPPRSRGKLRRVTARLHKGTQPSMLPGKRGRPKTTISRGNNQNTKQNAPP